MISRSQMNRQLYANGMIPDVTQEASSMLQGIRSLTTPKYMLPLDKLREIAAAQGVSIEEANDMVKRWAMGTGNPEGLEKLFIPRMSRETQDIPEYYDRRLQILEPEQMRQEMEDPSMPGRTDRAGGGMIGRTGYAAGSIFKGIKGLTKLQKAKQTKLMEQLDEASELASSRSDYNFDDYKMRGRIMAEELSELRYGKNFDDLDLDTQVELYSESSDYLNDAAASYGDTLYDAFKERGGKANGGIMNVAREKYGIGSSIKKFVRNIIPNEVAEIAVAAAPFVAPFNPALAAGMSGLGTFDQTGRIGQSLKAGALNYAGGQIARGVGGGIENLQGNPFGGGPIFTSPTTGNAITMDSLSNVFSAQEPFVGEEIYGPKNTEASGFTKVFDFLKGSAKTVGDVLQKTSDQDIKNILKAGELLVSGGLGYLSYKDQKRINENLAQIQEDYMKRVAEKKEEYGTGTMTVTRGEVNPVRAPAAYGGRMKYALGSVEEGIMAAPQIATMMGMPVGNPRKNQQGVVELDYRDEGGFVPPIGIKEKEDDIPAMLSNNEFVFTAESVKNADPSGRRDPAEGAKVMYRTMKMLENGGMV